jgi:flagellar basal-body rod modification protein FlgD
MQAINAVQNSGVAPVADATGIARDAAKAGGDAQDRFLKLLVAQMRNQDPLNPLDNAQVTSQLAQISTVSGIDRLNATLQTLAAGFAANQGLQAAGMIGRGVLAPGSTLTMENGAAIGGVDLPQPVDRLIVTIRDGSGTALHSMDLGPMPEGVLAFQWDGVTDSGARAVDGKYSFSVSAQQGDRKVDPVTLSFGRVRSISPESGGVVLDVSGLGMIGLPEIRQIL